MRIRPYIVREIAAPAAILVDMETRHVIGYRVYDPASVGDLYAAALDTIADLKAELAEREKTPPADHVAVPQKPHEKVNRLADAFERDAPPSNVLISSDNQINSSGMPLSCSDKLQFVGLSFLLNQSAPSRTHFSLKRSTPIFVASWYPCSTPQQGQNSKSGVAPSSPQGGLSFQHPQTLQLCVFFIAKCDIPMPCQLSHRNRLRGKRSHRKQNNNSREPDLPPRERELAKPQGRALK